MNILKTIASSFVDIDEKPEAPVQAKLVVTPNQIGTAAHAPTETCDHEMITVLQNVIANKKTAYTALVEAAEKLRNFIPDDNTRFKAAYAQIAGDGQRTVSSITQAIDVHINDVNGELIRFNQSSQAAINSKVGGLRSTVSQIASQQKTRASQIENLQSQIASLQQTIADDNVKSATLTNQADLAEAEISSKTAQFQAAVDSVKQDLINKKAQLAAALA